MQRSIGLGGLKTSKLHALKNVSGVLKPVGYPFHVAHSAFCLFLIAEVAFAERFTRPVTRRLCALCMTG